MGVLEFWSFGVLEFWSFGVLEFWKRETCLRLPASLESRFFYSVGQY